VQASTHQATWRGERSGLRTPTASMCRPTTCGRRHELYHMYREAYHHSIAVYFQVRSESSWFACLLLSPLPTPGTGLWLGSHRRSLSSPYLAHFSPLSLRSRQLPLLLPYPSSHSHPHLQSLPFNWLHSTASFRFSVDLRLRVCCCTSFCSKPSSHLSPCAHAGHMDLFSSSCYSLVSRHATSINLSPSQHGLLQLV